MSENKEKNALREVVKNKRSCHASPWFTRLSRPELWSLRARVLYTIGALLIFGNLCLIVFLSITLGNNLKSHASRQISLVCAICRNEISKAQRFLLAEATALANQPTLATALINGNIERIRNQALDSTESLRQAVGLESMSIVINGTRENPPSPLDMSPQLTTTEHSADLLRKGSKLILSAHTPVYKDSKILGMVRIQANLADLLSSLSLPLEYGISLLVPEGNATWAITSHQGFTSTQFKATKVPENELNGVFSNTLRRFTPLHDKQGEILGGLLLTYNIAPLQKSKWQNIYLYSWIFMAGALVIWIILFFNIKRITTFLDRLKRIIIASHSNSFSERFQSDHIYCRDYLKCNNEECPVYQNPSLVCYLETGSEAVSPKWRDTCIFLNKYGSCKNCPIYTMRRGDELNEMRNVINTMMRHWSEFLNHVGHFLPYLLRSQCINHNPTLDDISQRLEQMAKLTFFTHDLQGVFDKDEIFQQLSYVFREHFNLLEFVFFETDIDHPRMNISTDHAKNRPLCRRQVQEDCEFCRAYRTAEDVYSFYNPALCPYFNIDEAHEFRCCMPVVMAGKVGAVFTFVGSRREWEKGYRTNLPLLRKYLDESAPVLNSLGLLRMTKEQSLRDPLTHCNNRRFLDEFIVKYEPLAKREEQIVGFLMVDIDYFKQVNDTYGHGAGDAVLQQLVEIIKNMIRSSDLLIRYGGEEFLILLLNVEKGTAKEVAEKIRQAVEDFDFQLPEGQSLNKTISIGVSEFPLDADSMYKAMKFADVALYEAKNSGRNRVVSFLPEMWTSDQY